VTSPSSTKKAPVDREWWRRGVFYEIYVRSFGDTNSDGVGDLRGIIEHLDYLNDGTPQSLGVDALWITPVNPSPMFDFGYDVSDYRSIEPLFGTLRDYDDLIAAAHERGIRILLDLVPNHTSHQHSWFIESRSSRNNPKRDWYIWRDPAPGGGPPNNWVSSFGGRRGLDQRRVSPCTRFWPSSDLTTALPPWYTRWKTSFASGSTAASTGSASTSCTR
jgi:glycosidase